MSELTPEILHSCLDIAVDWMRIVARWGDDILYQGKPLSDYKNFWIQQAKENRARLWAAGDFNV